MYVLTQLDKLKIQLGIIDEEHDSLLNLLLSNALEYILAYCNRTELPPGLNQLQLQIAVIYYNRLGAEGEQGRSEGGIARTIYVLGDDFPKSIKTQLVQYRLSKLVRYASSST